MDVIRCVLFAHLFSFILCLLICFLADFFAVPMSLTTFLELFPYIAMSFVWLGWCAAVFGDKPGSFVAAGVAGFLPSFDYCYGSPHVSFLLWFLVLFMITLMSATIGFFVCEFIRSWRYDCDFKYHGYGTPCSSMMLRCKKCKTKVCTAHMHCDIEVNVFMISTCRNCDVEMWRSSQKRFFERLYFLTHLCSNLRASVPASQLKIFSRLGERALVSRVTSTELMIEYVFIPFCQRMVHKWWIRRKAVRALKIRKIVDQTVWDSTRVYGDTATGISSIMLEYLQGEAPRRALTEKSKQQFFI